MSLYIVAVTHPMEGRTLNWYFDTERDALDVKILAQEYGIYVSDNFADPEIITEFHEFESWWNEIKDQLVREALR